MFVYLYNKSILLAHTYDLLQNRSTDYVNVTKISLLFFKTAERFENLDCILRAGRRVR